MKSEIIFDDIINKNNKIEYVDTYDLSEALNVFVNHKYDMISFNGSMTLNPGDTILTIRDIISHINCDETICYIINDIEYPITYKTRLLTFLTPLNFIYLRNKSNNEQIITFKRWLIKPKLSDGLSCHYVVDGIHSYYYGSIYS